MSETAVASGISSSAALAPDLAEAKKHCAGCKNGMEHPKRCGKCFKVYYCSRDCQVKDWARHKMDCNKNIQINSSSLDEDPSLLSNNSGASQNSSRSSSASSSSAAIPMVENLVLPPDTFTGDKLYSLFDKSSDHADIASYLAFIVKVKNANGSADAKVRIPIATIKSYPNASYHNYPSLGVSLCYDSGKLGAIHLYPDKASGYDGYVGPIPHGISLADNNVDVVTKLGEPTMKGGQVISVWVAYDHLGLQVDFTSKDWEDRNNKIVCITLYKPK